MWAGGFQKPYEGSCKAVVISRADLMVEAAQNKLLKAIEEPPEHTVFLWVRPTVKICCLPFCPDV